MSTKPARAALMALALGGIVPTGIGAAGAAQPARAAIVAVPSDVVTEGLAVEDQVQAQLQLANRLVRDLPAPSQRQRLRVAQLPRTGARPGRRGEVG